MQGNTEQKNYEYGHFSRSVTYTKTFVYGLPRCSDNSLVVAEVFIRPCRRSMMKPFCENGQRLEAIIYFCKTHHQRGSAG